MPSDFHIFQRGRSTTKQGFGFLCQDVSGVYLDVSILGGFQHPNKLIFMI